ncbi:MAG: histone deacetylase [Planctomycetota bacterium]|jgi:hypothetical protein
MEDDLIWYVAYGSNLLSARFDCYLIGGKAPGATRKDPGARDDSPPHDERAMFLPYPLSFAGRFASWQGGGAAVLDPQRDDSVQTLARGYLITRAQFEDVLRQENADPAIIATDLPLEAGVSAVIGDGPYARVLCLGEQDGVPLYTCTAAADVEAAAPSKPYLQCLIAGLRETFALNKQGVRKYLEGLSGIKGRYPAPALNKAFDAADALIAE